ncbi:Protoheme IX farnesyltransferase, mitochondrial [Podila epicladia]|nr:Protoheme IX farnesyltransferase, mitochondrial [Podila epicladia]KAG0097502.1 Protoheme IX farnesyltransferase, mitochondrial [Podila epicladia]
MQPGTHMLSRSHLIRVAPARIQHRWFTSSCTNPHRLARIQPRTSLASLGYSAKSSAPLNGSRIMFTRASSSIPPTSTSLSDNDKDKDSSTTTITSTTPAGFQGYDIRWKEIKNPSVSDYISIYLDLSKARLGALVTLTTMAGYAMTPMGASLPTLFALTTGTALCITSANAYNQFVEPPYDAQMSRTRNRILVRKAVSPLHAWSFATLTGLGGTALLAAAVNPLTAALGAANLVLYAGVYTPMKRVSIANTWVGSVVGAIPPMMGWAACTNSLDPEAWLLGLLLYAWQFPHFNSLAWNLRADYSKAGYRMMAVTDPKLNARVSLRYSLALIPLVTLAPYLDMTSWWFAVDGNIVNGVMLAGAANFWRKRDDKTARQLFFGSLIYLPVILALMMFHKKGKQEVVQEIGSLEQVSESGSATHVKEEEDDDEYEYVDEDEEDEEEAHVAVKTA